jgi:hypothetical protein
LPQADLGPIKFVDYDSDEELGKYPSNWKDSELYSEDRYLEPTIIYIKRGPPGSKGPRGQSGTPGICQGNINISKIVGDDLEIASDNLKIASDNTSFKNKLCFGDDKKACLDKDLIQQIKTNKTIENERDACLSQVSKLRPCCTTKSALEIQVTTLNKKANDFETKFDNCDKLITDPNEYVTRKDCTNEVTAKNQEWVSRKLEETIQKQSEKIDELKLEIFNLKSDMVNWVQKRKAMFVDLDPDIQKQYGKITTTDSNGSPDEYIKYKDCSVAIAKDKDNYIYKNFVSFDDVKINKNKYIKISDAKFSTLNQTEKDKYMKKTDIRVSDATDKGNYKLLTKIVVADATDKANYMKKTDIRVSHATDKGNYMKRNEINFSKLSETEKKKYKLLTNIVVNDATDKGNYKLLTNIVVNDATDKGNYMKKTDIRVSDATDKGNYMKKTDIRVSDATDKGNYMKKTTCATEKTQQFNAGKNSVPTCNFSRANDKGNYIAKTTCATEKTQQFNAGKNSVTCNQVYYDAYRDGKNSVTCKTPPPCNSCCPGCNSCCPACPVPASSPAPPSSQPHYQPWR